jgi:hypothetical protein
MRVREVKESYQWNGISHAETRSSTRLASPTRASNAYRAVFETSFLLVGRRYRVSWRGLRHQSVMSLLAIAPLAAVPGADEALRRRSWRRRGCRFLRGGRLGPRARWAPPAAGRGPRWRMRAEVAGKTTTRVPSLTPAVEIRDVFIGQADAGPRRRTFQWSTAGWCPWMR